MSSTRIACLLLVTVCGAAACTDDPTDPPAEAVEVTGYITSRGNGPAGTYVTYTVSCTDVPAEVPIAGRSDAYANYSFELPPAAGTCEVVFTDRGDTLHLRFEAPAEPGPLELPHIEFWRAHATAEVINDAVVVDWTSSGGGINGDDVLFVASALDGAGQTLWEERTRGLRAVIPLRAMVVPASCFQVDAEVTLAPGVSLRERLQSNACPGPALPEIASPTSRGAGCTVSRGGDVVSYDAGCPLTNGAIERDLAAGQQIADAVTIHLGIERYLRAVVVVAPGGSGPIDVAFSRDGVTFEPFKRTDGRDYVMLDAISLDWAVRSVRLTPADPSKPLRLSEISIFGP